MKTLTPIHKFKRKILVTGGAGFIASSLAEKLAEDKENLVVVLDNLSTGNIDKLSHDSDNLRFIKADVNKYVEIMEVMLSYQFHYVFHYAAMVGVLRTQKNPIGVLDDIKGIENICRLSKNIGVRRVFYASSSEVYGEPVEFPQNVHTTPLNSRIPYAIVKNLGEAFLKSYQKEFGLNYTIFRFFNTYGPKQSKDFVISKFLYAALNNHDITIYGDGSQTRTFCYIDDNIEACTKIAYNDLFINEVVNIGNSIETSINELAEIIIRLTKSKSKIINVPPLAEGDMKRRCPDNSDMLKVLNRKLISLEDGIGKILKTGLFEITH
ncbi:MAG: NAD-dependent epimerase/dehydratase family protein [Bacteroidales bacterium]|jgi:nucleoside-diphosphate-sugar epimerase|nr:NAD-dependent epimerase/dehydratase family protein [Bacteroidales bacterium]HNY44054.1 NAD-dependent epimerase/dehydratase family protein [Bacteroidales bacterium]